MRSSHGLTVIIQRPFDILPLMLESERLLSNAHESVVSALHDI